jgi:lipoprotein NlpD
VSLLVVGLALSACGSKTVNRPPVEDRNHARGAAMRQSNNFRGYENAGKPGYYTVKPRDTLIGIGLEAGHSYKDIARWNALDNPDKIEVGQVLRVVPPASASEPVAVAVAKPVASAAITSTPIAPGQSKPAVAAASAASAAPVAAAPASAATPAAVVADDDMGWMWPANGAVLNGFDEAKNKGLDIGGASGDAVLAAADGRVVYAGAGLRGYGNLIILKHNNVYLTAYAHNKTLLVKEDATVKKGQKIAEMGDSDADRVKLHFEVRKQGKPVDPAKYMPAR